LTTYPLDLSALQAPVNPCLRAFGITDINLYQFRQNLKVFEARIGDIRIVYIKAQQFLQLVELFYSEFITIVVQLKLF
jgi:hypothetical protein